MNQYIITEELLQEAMENTTWGRTNQQKFRDKLTPYQSERDTCPQNHIWQHCPVNATIRKDERDKVLDEVITNIEFNGLKNQEEIWRMVEDLRKKTFDELERRFDYSDNTQFSCKKIRKILKELRQQEGESS
jgi:hypothetical protein